MKVVTFGSAIIDNFLKIDDEVGVEKGKITIPLGQKILLDDYEIHTGGGATNSACTFANMGIETYCFSKIGKDYMGRKILRDLDRFGVRSLVVKDKEKTTAVSSVISVKGYDRTIMSHIGACHNMKSSEIPWKKIQDADLFYIGPLSGKSMEIFDDLLQFANDNYIKVACNLSVSQIKSKDILKKLPSIDILFLNKKEAQMIVDKDIEDILKKLKEISGGIVVITKGEEGSIVIDDRIYSAPSLLVIPVERLGAGDAYAAGFTAGLLLKDNIEYAIQLGTYNAGQCTQIVGAKEGLVTLPQFEKSKRVKVT